MPWSHSCWFVSVCIYYKRGTGAATTIPSFRSYSDFTGSHPTDRDYLACLGWLALWPSWLDTGGQPSSLRPVSSWAQPVPRGQTIWSTALSGLDGPSDMTTRLSLFGCTAGTVVTQSTHSHPLNVSLTGLSVWGQAMLGRWSQHHLRL